MTRSTRTRRALLATAALASAAVLAGCGASETTNYAASDGVDVTLGHLTGDNLMVLTAAKGDPGTMIGALINDGDQPMTVQLGVGSAVVPVQVPARSTVLLGPQQNAPAAPPATTVDVRSVPAPPGALVSVSVASDVSGRTTVQVPVLDGTLPAYASLVPSS
ncbi:hypothetical protein Q6346_10120 [Isoptericola sp. b490]|uniref:hypothetical protein n=1 Tax=Actinotalea lenta TaxID=3064654 RepID=UPI0027128B28|nr:hypothetical protein [Isoptericola sp. b490]MDO8121664.1 hypothetical protein [Isoptericola sp. b490]